MHSLRLAPLLFFLLLLSGCNNFLAQHMVLPPNGGISAAHEPARLANGEQRLYVDAPPALLSYWVLEPKAPAKGTILVLHGFLADHHVMQGAAEALRDGGYRAVLVDLRGHGHSSGDHITYGVQDARDLMRLTDFLQQNKQCGASVGVYGQSYGAATAILFAGADPRVSAVVAVAPFATLREEAPYFGRHLLPIPALFMSDSDFVSVVDQMGKVAAFDPDACSPLAAIQKTTAHVRLFHGTLDMIVATKSSQDLAAAAPTRTQRTLMPGKGHLELCFDLLGILRPETQAWFDKYLTPVASTSRSDSPEI